MGIFDWINNLTADALGAIKGIVFVVALVVVIVVAAKTRFAIASTLMTFVVAGVVVWLVTLDGLGWFASRIDAETNSLGLLVITSIL